jgi:hypothetical protein
MQGSPVLVPLPTCIAESRPVSVVRDLAQEDIREYWREIDWFAPHEADGLDGYLFAEDAEVRKFSS